MKIDNVLPIQPSRRLDHGAADDTRLNMETLARQAAGSPQSSTKTKASDDEIVPDKDGWANAKFFLTTPEVEVDDEDDLIKTPPPMPFRITVRVKFPNWAERVAKRAAAEQIANPSSQASPLRSAERHEHRIADVTGSITSR